jgi:hypothetical protein
MCRFVLLRERVKIQHGQSNCYVFRHNLTLFHYAIADDMPRFSRSELNQFIQFTIHSFVTGQNGLVFILKYSESLGGLASGPTQGAYDAPPDPLVNCHLDLRRFANE